MKLLRLLLVFLCLLAFADAKTVNVKGYYRKDGTYVAPHTRSSPSKKSYSGSSSTYTAPAVTPVADKPAAPANVQVVPDKPKTEAATYFSKTEIPPVFSSLKSGMLAVDVKRFLGVPREVESKPDFETWVYPAGVIFFKNEKVVAWREVSK